MGELLFGLLKTIRPRQWIKNLSMYAALVFSGNLFVPENFWQVTASVFIFSILVSSIYIFNDIMDAPLDRMHPFKKNRPIAAGRVPVSVAFLFFLIGSFTALFLGFNLSIFLFMSMVGYLILQILYTLLFKHMAVLDVMAIATGFIIRVYAGAFVINAHLSVWFLLCVISSSLFLAVGKRRAELSILTEQTAPKHRKTFSIYSPDLLDTYLAMFANSAWMSWAIFTFFEPPPVIPSKALLVLANFPLTLSGTNKWLMLTTPIVIFGVMRYAKVVYEGARAESPASVLLSDWPLLASVFFWAVMVVGVIYAVG